MGVPEPAGPLLLSLTAIPVSYVVNSMSAASDPLAIAGLGVLVLLSLLVVLYFFAQGNPPQDPLFYVFAIFSFTSVIDLIIWLEEDGYISGFMEFYMKEGEPYLRTAHGMLICLWDGTVHYLLYLVMLAAIARRQNIYRGMATRSCYLEVFINKGSSPYLNIFLIFSGKYGTEIRPAFILNIPYLFLPVWAGIRIFTTSHAFPKFPAETVVASQSKGIFQRPLDMFLILYLLGAILFTLFRGLLVLDCPTDSCFTYIYQYEPYLRDPSAYSKVQMLVNMFYLLPFLCMSIYGLLIPGCFWMLDWTLVFAGAVAQAQFAHMGSSVYHRTPYTYRVPQESWWEFMILNAVYTLGMQMLAYRCYRNPTFFIKGTTETVEEGKKQN
ncbi:transmembrane 6 superfamily member 2 [Pyxicephalus adspersus]|uniref:transmembrane 6 superfamily member 2 n=1 Tax=Pyxicephalus adspersus TaxID=30357 RepID=UPI003B5C01A4